MLKNDVACIYVIALSTLLVHSANAQLFSGLKDRLANAVEERIERNVEDRVVKNLEDSARQSVDQSFNAIFSGVDATGAPNGQGGPSILSSMLDTSNLKLQDEYNFDIAANFEIQAFDSDGQASEPMQMVFHYAENAPYTGTQMLSGDAANAGAAMIIYDFDNQAMIMLMDTDGSRFSIAYNWAIAAAEWNKASATEAGPSDVTQDVPQFESIGTRTINGYSSEGYRTVATDQVTEIWVSDEVAPGIERIFQANRTVPMMNASMPEGYPQGMVMELTSENTKTAEKVVMRTLGIDTGNQVSFKMSDYPLMSLGAQAAASR
jgi:hypothetical protein